VATPVPLLCDWILSPLVSVLVDLGSNTSPCKICVVVESRLKDSVTRRPDRFGRALFARLIKVADFSLPNTSVRIIFCANIQWQFMSSVDLAAQVELLVLTAEQSNRPHNMCIKCALKLM